MYSIVIQAGGKSSRMGQDKSFLPLCGLPLFDLVVNSVSGLGNDLIITSNEPEKFRFYHANVVQDEYGGVGALAGLHAGIKASKNELVIAVANDMPFISVKLFAYMQQQIRPDVDVVIPCSSKGYEPFHAIYRRSTCLPAIERAILAKKKRIVSWFEDVKVLTVSESVLQMYDPKGLAFFNVNTVEDLKFAESICAQS